MNEESLEAFERIKPFLTDGRMKVLNALIELLKAKGDRFPTLREIANSMGDKTPNDISGRLTQLVELGIIYKLPSEGKGARYNVSYNIVEEHDNVFTTKLYFKNMVGDTLSEKQMKANAWVEITQQSLRKGGYTVINVLEAFDCMIIKYVRTTK